MKKNSSNKSFGLVFFVVFLLIGLWPLKDAEPVRIWAILISFMFLVLSLFNSILLGPLSSAWIKFGEYIGRVISPIIMGLIYFIVLTPIGLFMRLIGKDLLKRNFSKVDSYWIKREKKIGSMKKQF